MIDGGQQIASIDQHLQNGDELFETNPKGALAAYYQVVSLEPTHVEGWNQIGRLMFDMQQFAEAEMVFKRVEQLSIQQGLADWAEMSVQNIELTRQTLAEGAASNQSDPVMAEQEVVTKEVVQEQAVAIEPEPETITSEETQSTSNISDFGSVAQNPEVDATVLFQPEAVQEIAEDTAIIGELANVPPMEIVQVEPVVSPLVKASAQTIEVVDETGPALAPISAEASISALAEELTADAFTSMSNAPSAVLDSGLQPIVPALPDTTEILGQSGAPVSPAAMAPPAAMPPPAGQMPFGQHLQAASALAQTQAGSRFPNMPMAEQPEAFGGQQAELPPMAPPPQFAVQPGPPKAAPLAASAAPVLPPSMVPPTPDVAMEEPKSSSGKIALMITGVVGAVGIGIGAAQYLNTPKVPVSSIPVIKSEVKLEPKSIITTVIVPELEKTPEIAEPVIAKPQITDRDRAYKIGMTHLVKGEYAEAHPFLESAAAAGHAEASFNLASLYAKGEGVDQSYAKAVSYLQKSTDGGYYPAMTNLGLLYAKGQGVDQNFLTARSLWLKAAAGEHADAMHNLAVIYATGKGVEKDMDEAIKWYRKGANAGYVDSIFDLGLLYANGDGVTRDYAEAKRLWETAAAKGHKLAVKNLEKLEQVMVKQ